MNSRKMNEATIEGKFDKLEFDYVYGQIKLNG